MFNCKVWKTLNETSAADYRLAANESCWFRVGACQPAQQLRPENLPANRL